MSFELQMGHIRQIILLITHKYVCSVRIYGECEPYHTWLLSDMMNNAPLIIVIYAELRVCRGVAI